MFKRILVPIDGSAAAQSAVQQAVKLASEEAKMRLIYVVEESHSLDLIGYGAIDYSALLEALRQTGKRALATAADEALKSGFTVETELLDAPGERISSVIGGEADKWNADLIVIGTHGRSGLNRLLLGSVAEEVVRSASVPVLMVHADSSSA